MKETRHNKGHVFFPGLVVLISTISFNPTVGWCQQAAQVLPNDNRHSAGALQKGIVELNLEARPAIWYPEEDGGPVVPVFAFAEIGGPAQIPGPFLRVPQGTDVRITIRNSIPKGRWIGLPPENHRSETTSSLTGATLFVHGRHDGGRHAAGSVRGSPRSAFSRRIARHLPLLARDARPVGALPKHLVPVVQFALATGCRMTEILSLEWRRVDFNRRVSWLDHGTTKNGDGRGIPLNRDAVLALRSVQGQHNRWCFTYQGNRMEKVGSAWKRSLKRAGIEKFRFHDLRYSWASWHVMNGTTLQELMELGGWKSYEMALRYAHLAPEHLSNAAARIERRLGIVGNDSTISLR